MAKKILFINQEIVPYVPDSDLALMGKALPQAMLDGGHEIRTFMPKWGTINERRGQLHEVIRLSGVMRFLFAAVRFTTILTSVYSLPEI